MDILEDGFKSLDNQKYKSKYKTMHAQLLKNRKGFYEDMINDKIQSKIKERILEQQLEHLKRLSEENTEERRRADERIVQLMEEMKRNREEADRRAEEDREWRRQMLANNNRGHRCEWIKIQQKFPYICYFRNKINGKSLLFNLIVKF